MTRVRHHRCRRLLLSSLCLLWLSARVSVAEAPRSGLAAVLQPLVERRELAGAVVLAADKERVLEVGTSGFADVESDRPMTADTLFWIASMTKPMTGAAVMMLVDEGRLDLDDPVQKFLPEFQGQQLAVMAAGKQTGLKAPSRPITVRDVLSHTSGLPFKSPEEEPVLDSLPLAQAVKTYAALPLQFEPGAGFLYSNAGINTAARVLEVVTGMKYEDFMQQWLFTPLGMKDTTFWPTAEQAARLATAYKPGPDGQGLEPLQIPQLHYPLSDRARRHPMPAGGLFSTAADVAVFGQMILNGGQWQGRRYLSEKAVQILLSRHTAPNLSRAYGLGWNVEESGAGHGGAFATHFTLDLRHNLVLVYLVQHSGFPGQGKSGLGLFKKAALSAYGKKMEGQRDGGRERQ